MVNPNERNINLKWHNLREEDSYLDPIKTIQQISLWTSINNYYYYTRVLDTSVTPPVRLENFWEVTLNGVPQYELDDLGLPTQDRLTKRIETIRPLLSEFYTIFKPGTLIPVEVPVKVVLN